MSSNQVLEIPAPADFHVHLRQGSLSALVTPHVRKGGFTLAYVMVRIAIKNIVSISLLQPTLFSAIQPNLRPPITTTDQALAYKNDLEALDPHVEYLMTLYLCPELTPEEIRKASKAGIVG